MKIAAIGLNHHNTPIAIRERFALHKQKVQEGLHFLKNEGVHELAILSTCNRTEIYCHTDDFSPLYNWLAQIGQLSEKHLSSYLFMASSHEAIRHIFRVASGLDSMIVGEPNIFGQIKEAVQWAQERQTLGSILHRLFQSSFAVAKEVRRKTDIGRHEVSMATVSLQLAENIFEDLSACRILFVGTGDMINLAATYFCNRHPQSIMFVSHHGKRAESLSQRFGGQSGLTHHIDRYLADFDIVITCTHTSQPIIHLEMALNALKKRQYLPMMIVDLGVPRNVDSEIAKNSDFFLYTVDDLQEIIEANLSQRHQASQKAKCLVETRVDDFLRYLDHRRAVKTICGLRHTMQNCVEQEVHKAMRKLEQGKPSEAVLQHLAHRLSNQWIHPWIAQLQRVEGKSFDECLQIYQSVLCHTHSNLTSNHSMVSSSSASSQNS